MDATAWTVVWATIALLVAIGTSFRSLRTEMRAKGLGCESASTRRETNCESASTRRETNCESASTRREMNCENASTPKERQRAIRSASCANGWRTSKACSKVSARPLPASE